MIVTGLSRDILEKDQSRGYFPLSYLQTKPADNSAKPVCYEELKLRRIPPGASKQTSGKRRGLIKEETLK